MAQCGDNPTTSRLRSNKYFRTGYVVIIVNYRVIIDCSRLKYITTMLRNAEL